MHPPLSEHKHESEPSILSTELHSFLSPTRQANPNSFISETKECIAVMTALKECHSGNPYAKFLGVCNDEKTALNMCLRGERIGKANDNNEKAKAKRRIVEEKWQRIKDEEA